MIIGFAILLIADVCQGSFGLGYKKYEPLSWAAFWGIYNILCIVTSVGCAWLSALKLWTVISENSPTYWSIPILCGALWGFSAIGLSKAMSPNLTRRKGSLK